MGNTFKPVAVFALFFLLLGLVWSTTIYLRCRIISPVPVVSTDSESGEDGVAGEKETEKLFRRIRSPHAKLFHSVLFYALAALELIVSFLYILCAWALFRKFKAAKTWVLAAVGADIFFKCGVAGYLYFFANPLQMLIKTSHNLIWNYYIPDGSLTSVISGFLSGLLMYKPRLSPFLLVYIVYFYSVMLFLKLMCKEKSLTVKT